MRPLRWRSAELLSPNLDSGQPASQADAASRLPVTVSTPVKPAWTSAEMPGDASLRALCRGSPCTYVGDASFAGRAPGDKTAAAEVARVTKAVPSSWLPLSRLAACTTACASQLDQEHETRPRLLRSRHVHGARQTASEAAKGR